MRPKTLSAVVILFVLLSALTCFAQQTEVTQFAAFGSYSYLSTPSLNLAQRGFDGDFGYNYNSWLTLGFDFSTFRATARWCRTISIWRHRRNWRRFCRYFRPDS